ncbi:cation:proton antiporter domain-containing protein [Trichloromonas sp.]|uniref:cation:proton antiporter domain-containing protein n=1 Tax=Trichloromonas sp. TaxID=3069249 RepID=UPI003D8174C3
MSILTTLAIILLGALAGGRLASLCHIPRVTGYLLTGLLLGPSLAHLLGLPPVLREENLDSLSVLSEIGLALILTNIGAQFRAENLRRWGGRILIFSFAETAGTFLLVGAATSLTNLLLLGYQVGSWTVLETSLALGVLFGSIAMTTAPAATMMVIREYESEGPVTTAVMTLIGLNNLATITVFTLAATLLTRPATGYFEVLVQLVVPLTLGGLLGLGLSFWAQRLELGSEHKLLLLGGVILTVSLCGAVEVNPLLACFALGMVLANSSPIWHRLFESLKQVDYPLYVIFFMLAGARLHLETLFHIGLLGVAYVVARSLAKWLGPRIGARFGNFGERERATICYTLFSQGGVAIGLAAGLAASWPEGGKLVETVVLGSVVVFELVGPLAVRHGLVRAGEVPLLSLLQKRVPQDALEGLHSVVSHFRSSLGLPAGHQVNDPGDILVRHVMRQNVETIRNNTPYHDLLKIIAHSRYDRFPVVDGRGSFVGMIDYTEIRNLLFEPSLMSLVVAGDLTSADHYALYPDQPLREALTLLEQKRSISFFPVVDREQPDRLLGILSQNDVMAAFRRLK